MSTFAELRKIAMGLEGTTEAPHFDRTAYKAARIYATVAADGKSANFYFTPEQQTIKIALYPHAFSPVNGAWGRNGWTVGVLSKLDAESLSSALETAWKNAQPKKRPRKR